MREANIGFWLEKCAIGAFCLEGTSVADIALSGWKTSVRSTEIGISLW